MKTFLKVAAIVAATLPILAGSAHAIVIGNGWGTNGIGNNGIGNNGIGNNGIGNNGIGNNGVKLNALAPNALGANGVSNSASQSGTVQAVEGLRLLSVQLPSS